MNEFRILLVDDDEGFLESMADNLEDRGYDVDKALSSEEALKILSKNDNYNLAIVDLCLPGMDGIGLLKRLNKKYVNIRVAMLTGHGTVTAAVDAMKLGAIDFLQKPLHPEKLLIFVQKECERQQLVDQNAYFMAELCKRNNIDNIIGTSPAMLEVFKQVRDISDADSTVLITGESGTGKELIANHIHYTSRRKDGPFIKFSCAVLAQGVLESELFGHERGSFTGAVKLRRGRFESAHKGTLFLDEIGDIPLTSQVKLLRVLQSTEFERVGQSKSIKSDFRLICATNHDLMEDIDNRTFREDLYYRIRVLEIILPPLRNRREEISILVNHFIKIYSHQTNKRIRGISDEAMSILVDYDWPGNVRELKNAIESATVYCKGDVIDTHHLPHLIHTPKIGTLNLSQLPTRSLAEIEKELIALCLQEVKGNKTKAAGMLGISRPTLYDKMKKHGLTPQN
ncbi:hypothetical protein CEE37_12340 [candidate division LCP-89 bacterium B3_LCP]|uniref:Sigma-54-dependent Fis family transcriptional regulator n=1 Tax=candidate division LCP-89 bacterium B3_LCP TaxID=2012998 RepID=A0A532UUC6_UNCL8|nr:MAG: hypothetical protein CEE37_12340 [candidate division LCP-89 bacterium B3_LCP]